MKSKLFLFGALMLVLCVGIVSADILAEWDLVEDVVAITHDNVNAEDFTANGVGTLAFGTTYGNGVYVGSWDIEINKNKYFEIILEPKEDFGLTITEIGFDILSPSTEDPKNYQIKYSKDSFVTEEVIEEAGVIEGNDDWNLINLGELNIQVNEGETISIRLFGYGSITGNLWIKSDTLKVIGTATADPLLSIEKTAELTKTQNGTVNITNDGNVELINLNLIVVSEAGFKVEFNNADFSLAPGASQLVEIYSEEINTLNFGDDNTFSIKANNTEIESNILEFEVPLSFCEDCANQGELDVEIKDVYVTEGFGDYDDGYLYPLDEIEVEIEIENKGDWDIEDIVIEVCLLNTETGECIMDEGDMDLDEDDFDLDKGDDQTIILTFNLDPDDLDEDKDYELHIKAIGTIDDSDSLYHEDKTCDSNSEDLTIRTDESFIIMDDFVFTEVVQCGEEVQIIANIWNIGDEKIDEDNVYVWVYSNDLKIDKVINVDSISALDNEKLDLLINIPSQAIEGWNKITFTVYDDEDVDDIYENKEGDEAVYEINIKVEGNCLESIVSVYADLESGGKAGQELTVKAIITNLGNELVNYNLQVSGEDEWASSVELSQSTIVLDAGESKEVLITFDVNKDALGEQLFNIEVLDGEELILEQPVLVSIEKSGFSFPGITGNVISKDNWYLWGIGALNVILVLIIISIAVKVMKK
ncbi:putative S-layer protein [Candidatus Pacearchaeota archaeon]|nr:putative S-layer protein [Candidatus Pacearchaeota archaeon]